MTDRPYTLPQAAMLAGIEYRTLHSWVEKGLLPLSQPAEGTGYPALLTDREVTICKTLARLRRAGCGMEILQVAVRAFRRWPADDTIRLALPGDVSLSLSLSEDKFTKADTP